MIREHPRQLRSRTRLSSISLGLAIAVLCTACSASTQAASPKSIGECSDDSPVVVSVGASAWHSSQAKVNAALQVMAEEVRALAARPGSPGVRLSLYPLFGGSLDAKPF